MSEETPRGRRRYVPAVSDNLKKLLFVVFGLFALLTINSVYLVGVTVMEAVSKQTYQNWFYMNMFIVHLILGALIIIPVIVFGIIHLTNTYDRRNRRAVKVGYGLFVSAIILLASGVVLTRLEGVIVINDATTRSIAYWAHVITPLLAGWLFVLHRLAGRRIKWKIGLRWAAVAAAFGVIMLVWQAQDPRQWNVVGPASGEKYFFPSLARTATGDFIPEKAMMNDQYCKDCHADSHEGWANSVHRFSSFNNPPYLTSVRETRKVSLERDGEIRAARWCAGCHDPVVFFSGKFDDPNFDDVNDPTAKAGITCTVCHAITHVNSRLGNSDYTIEESEHYPFAFTDNKTLKWVNHQLIKAKPALHKKTFLKDFHKSAEFCAACHKVHLPPELNNYKWLRGQNHYDAYHLSGVSGHGITSFYYPPKATHDCNTCHMQPQASDQFSAKDLDGSGENKIHNHLFPSANTGIPHLLGLPDWVNEAHRKFNDGVMRVDIFSLREGGGLDGKQYAPLRPDVPTLNPGATYLLDAIIRTVKMGHLFTQGTADSNEIWLDVLVTCGDEVIGRSGGLGPDNAVDPWSHFVNIYMLDKDGNRIDRRNAQDIFVPLYNHQIPPGAADAVHYELTLPKNLKGPVTVTVRLQYRKFDTVYMKKVLGDEYQNELPIMTLAHDEVTFPVAGVKAEIHNEASPIVEWQRWNDYGIGLLRKGGKTKGELRQAEAAFAQVEALGRPDGPLNLSRVYLLQGTVQDKAIAALQRAASHNPPAPAWSVAWFTGQVNKQNGYLNEAIANFKSIIEVDNEETRRREFDFSQDYNLLTVLGETIYERAKQERGEAKKASRDKMLTEAVSYFDRALMLDTENMEAHYNLSLIWRQLGDPEKAKTHLALYQKYKPDDNAGDRAIAVARSNDPAANHAAEAVVIYGLNRAGAYEINGGTTRKAEPFELKPPVNLANMAGDAERRN